MFQRLEELNGQDVKIETEHKLYGREKYECVLQLINDEQHVGFKFKDWNICVKKDCATYELSNGIHCIRGELMTIFIEKICQ